MMFDLLTTPISQQPLDREQVSKKDYRQTELSTLLKLAQLDVDWPDACTATNTLYCATP